MPKIVSSKIVSIRPQVDGRVYYDFEIVDDKGNVTVEQTLLEKGADAEKIMAFHVAMAESFVPVDPKEKMAEFTDAQIKDEFVKRDLKLEVAPVEVPIHG